MSYFIYYSNVMVLHFCKIPPDFDFYSWSTGSSVAAPALSRSPFQSKELCWPTRQAQRLSSKSSVNELREEVFLEVFSTCFLF